MQQSVRDLFVFALLAVCVRQMPWTLAVPVADSPTPTPAPASPPSSPAPNCSAPANVQSVLNLLNSPSVLKLLSPLPLPATPGDRHCPAAFSLLPPSAPLRERSSCPWYLEVEELGPGFVPPVLLSARCRCRHCLTSGVMGCETVLADVRLLHVTDCQGGEPSVTITTRPVGIGCTCAQALAVGVEETAAWVDYAQ